jgi:hypothetical protein
MGRGAAGAALRGKAGGVDDPKAAGVRQILTNRREVAQMSEPEDIAREFHMDDADLINRFARIQENPLPGVRPEEHLYPQGIVRRLDNLASRIRRDQEGLGTSTFSGEDVKLLESTERSVRNAVVDAEKWRKHAERLVAIREIVTSKASPRLPLSSK